MISNAFTILFDEKFKLGMKLHVFAINVGITTEDLRFSITNVIESNSDYINYKVNSIFSRIANA